MKKIFKKNIVMFVLLFAVVFIVATILLYTLWLKPLLRSPISESLDLSPDQESRFPGTDHQPESGDESDNQEPLCVIKMNC
jgi:hypothetical protein